MKETWRIFLLFAVAGAAAVPLTSRKNEGLSSLPPWKEARSIADIDKYYRARGLLMSPVLPQGVQWNPFSQKLHATTRDAKRIVKESVENFDLHVTLPPEGDPLRTKAVEGIKALCKQLKTDAKASTPPAVFDAHLNYTVLPLPVDLFQSSLSNIDTDYFGLGRPLTTKDFQLIIRRIGTIQILSLALKHAKNPEEQMKTERMQCVGEEEMPRLTMRVVTRNLISEDDGELYHAVQIGKFTEDGLSFDYFDLPNIIINGSFKFIPVDNCQEEGKRLMCSRSASSCNPLSFEACQPTRMNASSAEFTFARAMPETGKQIIATRMQKFIIRNMLANHDMEQKAQTVTVPDGGVFALVCPSTQEAVFGSQVVRCLAPDNFTVVVTALPKITDFPQVNSVVEPDEEGSGFESNSVVSEETPTMTKDALLSAH